jgi:hypothetical protein
VLSSVKAPPEGNWEVEGRDGYCCFIQILPFESTIKNMGPEGFICRLKEFFIADVDGLRIKNRSELLFAETFMFPGK